MCGKGPKQTSMLAFVSGFPLPGREAKAPCVSTHHAMPVPSRRSRRSFLLISCANSPQTTEQESAGVRYQDDGTRVVPVPVFIRGTEDETVAGTYGVMDASRELTYVGMSRDVAKSLTLHAENHGDEASYVKVMTFTMPRAQEMKMIVDTWLSENGSLPKGNVEKWVEADEELAREASLLEASQPGSSDTVVSPFENDEIEVEETVEMLPLSTENVDTVLDEVRPYLISDGGNISIKSVSPETGVVKLVLEGACGSCSSASMTMQMGVERTLRAKFGNNLKEVVAVSAEDSASSGITVQECEAVLNQVRSALNGLGATVKVLEVDEGEVVLSYNGPNNLKYGVELMLKEKMPGVEAITFQ